MGSWGWGGPQQEGLLGPPGHVNLAKYITEHLTEIGRRRGS